MTWAEDKIAENAEKEEEALALEETEREAPALEDGEDKNGGVRRKLNHTILTKNILAEWWKMAVHFCAQSFFVYFVVFHTSSIIIRGSVQVKLI